MQDVNGTFQIIDPDLVNQSGHCFSMAYSLKTALEQRNWKVRVHTPGRLDDPASFRSLQPEQTLHRVTDKLFDVPVIDIGAANHQTYLDLSALGAPAPEEVLFFTTVVIRNLFGITRWLDRVKAERGALPKLIFLLWSQQCFDGPTGTIHHRNSELFRHFLSWVAEQDQSRITVYTFSERHVEHLSHLCDARVELNEFPLNGFSFNFGGEEKPEPDGQGSDGPVLGYLGNSWWIHKGLRQILGAIRLLRGWNVRVRYLLQIDVRFADYDADALLAEYADVLNAPEVEVCHGCLAPDDYKRRMLSCDVLALPYGPAYEWQPSGILHEGLWYGKPVVVPSRSSMADTLRRLGVSMPSYAEWTGEGVAAACRQAVDGLDGYKAAMASISKEFRRCRPVDRFLDRLGCHGS
ncbi:hypothetical protein CRT60_01330 [Azospirillum palustre]|uniref:Glycosyltransferase n=1 Tax=Azospirillum palustre TaxID=2044885 RepID=A0A2B8BMY1_9PROT|nr:glycosyltransferase [Azospirillum palustre]PGH59301.1 hypothetical protein CRT60_01330 [Azospirillum palustre]